MEARPNNPTCPVCKSVIHKDKVIPLYGRGTADQQDPREKVPPRPQGQREEPPNREEVSPIPRPHFKWGCIGGVQQFTLLSTLFLNVIFNTCNDCV